MNNQNKQEGNTNLSDKELFKIFHNNYDGDEIKKILQSGIYDITNENIYDGKNILFALGCNLNLQEYYPLLEKEYKKLGKDIKKCLNKLDNKGNSILLYAINIISQISRNLKDNVTYDNDMDIDIIEHKCFENIKFLIEQGCDINIEINKKNYLEYIYSNQIIKNFKKYSLDLTEYLIDKGLKPNYDDDRQHKLIYGVCEYNHLDLLNLLLTKGADKNLVLNDNLTLLKVASKNNNFEIVKVLLEKGLDVNFGGEEGFDPLYYSVLNCNIEIYNLLVDHGAKTNNNYINDDFLSLIEIPDNFNLLHLACEVFCSDIIMDLIDKGLKLNIKGDCKISPNDILKKKTIGKTTYYDIFNKEKIPYEEYMKLVKEEKIILDDVCPICLTTFSDSIVVSDKCGRSFRLGCLLQSFKSGNTLCPMCKQEIDIQYICKFPKLEEAVSLGTNTNTVISGSREEVGKIEEKSNQSYESIFQKRLNRLRKIRLRTGKAVYNNNNLNNNTINNNTLIKDNSISKNLNDLNKEERLKLLREEYLKTNKFNKIKIKMKQIDNSKKNYLN